MQIDYALILSAGLGTRMGEIGKELPKVMWPILNKKLIDLQISFCRSLGIKKIFINIHYRANVISEYVRENPEYNDVVLLMEDPLLDSGGAIHNLAAYKDVNYTGNVLTVNGDQFLHFDFGFYQKAVNLLSNSRGVLFGINVDKEEKYNETVLNDQSELIDIIKNNGEKGYVTFSGIGLIKLDGLEKIKGPSKFFQTVVNYKKEKVKFIVPDKIEYWDFGTATQYYFGIKKLKSERESSSVFCHFVKKNGVDFSLWDSFYNEQQNSICLDLNKRFENNTLVYKEIRQQL